MWKEYKTQTSATFSKLVEYIEERGGQVLAIRPLNPSSSGLSKETYISLIKRFENDLSFLKHNSKDLNRDLQRLEMEIRSIDESLHVQK